LVAVLRQRGFVEEFSARTAGSINEGVVGELLEKISHLFNNARHGLDSLVRRGRKKIQEEEFWGEVPEENPAHQPRCSHRPLYRTFTSAMADVKT